MDVTPDDLRRETFFRPRATVGMGRPYLRFEIGAIVQPVLRDELGKEGGSLPARNGFQRPATCPGKASMVARS